MPRVYNRRAGDAPDDAVYVGRPGKWGNPYVIGRDGSREDVIRMYKAYLLANAAVRHQAEQELRGKDLVCWCAPLPCHADVLLEIANASD